MLDIRVLIQAAYKPIFLISTILTNIFTIAPITVENPFFPGCFRLIWIPPKKVDNEDITTEVTNMGAYNLASTYLISKI